MQRCQLKKWASAGICACLLLASLTACGEQPAEAEASSMPTNSTMSEASSSPSSEPSPESSSQPESSSAPSEPEVSSASETEPAVSSSSPASEALSSEPQSSAPPAPVSSEASVSSEAPAPSGELMNKITVQFQDESGNPVPVYVYQNLLTTPVSTIDLTGFGPYNQEDSKKYLVNYSLNESVLSFSIAKGCKLNLTYLPQNGEPYGLTDNSVVGQLNFETDAGAATDAIYVLTFKGNGATLYDTSTLIVKNETYLE